MATKNHHWVVELRHYNLYRSCLLIYGISIVRSLSFSLIDNFDQNVNNSVAIESGSTVLGEVNLTLSLRQNCGNWGRGGGGMN